MPHMFKFQKALPKYKELKTFTGIQDAMLLLRFSAFGHFVCASSEQLNNLVLLYH